MSATHQIPVLDKALRLVQAVGDPAVTPSTPASLARALQIAPATAYRIVQTLVQGGWLRLDADRQCVLGPQLLQLAEQAPQHARLRAVLEELRDATGLTCKASFRDGDEAVTLLRMNSREPMALAIQAGARFHLTIGSSGAVILAGLTDAEVKRVIKSAPASCWQHQNPDDVRARVAEARASGTVVDTGSYRPDIFGVSVGYSGGALTVTGLRHGFTKPRIAGLRKLLLQKAGEL